MKDKKAHTYYLFTYFSMHHTQMLELLSTMRVFRKAKTDIIASVIQSSYIEEFAPNTQVLREWGGSWEYGYIILSGSVDVYIEWGHVTTLSKGNIFGEYAPIFRTNRTASVVVRDSLKCLVLNKRTLLMLIGHGCGLNTIMLQRIDENIRHNRWVFRKQ